MLQVQKSGGVDDQQDVFTTNAIGEAVHLVGKADKYAAVGEGVRNTVTKGGAAAPDHINQLHLVVNVGGEVYVVILAQIKLCPDLTEKIIQGHHSFAEYV